MKEIKAYIRRDQLNKVVDALERAGVPGITIVEIHPVGYGYEPNYFGFQCEDAFRRYRHLSVVKIEVTCADQDAERFVQIIQDACHTGGSGDGRIFISDVAVAVRIRDSARGQDAL